MRALELDYRRPDSTVQAVGYTLLAAGLCMAIGAGVIYERIAAQLADAEARVKDIGVAKRRPVPEVRAPADLQRIALETKKAGEVAVQLQLPWKDLFASVESAGTPDVALLGIESDVARRQVKISAEARSPESMLSYVRFLGTQSSLSGVVLQSHRMQLQDPQLPIRFIVSADWPGIRP